MWPPRTLYHRCTRWLRCRTSAGRAHHRCLDAATLWQACLDVVGGSVGPWRATVLCYIARDPAWQRPHEWQGTLEDPEQWLDRLLGKLNAAAAVAEREAEDKLRALRGRPPCE